MWKLLMNLKGAVVVKWRAQKSWDSGSKEIRDSKV